MKISSCGRMVQLEGELILSGVSALELMDGVAEEIARAIRGFYPYPGVATAYIGKGNNGGDALRVLYHLAQAGWSINIRAAYPYEQWGALLKLQWERLHSLAPMTGLADLSGSVHQQILGHRLNSGTPQTVHLLLDGLLGVGASGILRSEISALCQEMNKLRQSTGNTRICAIDIPTGIDADTGIPQQDAVVADYTAVIGLVKQGLVHDEATGHVGRLIPITLPGLDTSSIDTREVLNTERDLAPLLAPRPYELFKNKAGHVGVIAGSFGMLGAARLCSEAALKAGAGLVSLIIPKALYPIIAPSLPAEVIVRPYQKLSNIDFSTYQSLLIGPGLGFVDDPEMIRILHELIERYSGPIVLDADGLNLASRRQWKLKSNVLATPHPGEMARLVGRVSGESRKETVIRFVEQHEATVVYKGARTIITRRGAPIYYNSSGGPSMATAGEGDVLAGVCAGLCAQGKSLLDSARLAVYLCGKASEIQLSKQCSSECSLTAQDTLHALPQAQLATSMGLF